MKYLQHYKHHPLLKWSSEFLRRPKNGVDSNIKLYPELNKLDQKVRI